MPVDGFVRILYRLRRHLYQALVSQHLTTSHVPFWSVHEQWYYA